MPRKFTRDTCFCGCERERRPGSKYYSEKCQQAVWRRKLQVGGRQLPRANRAVFTGRVGATITDPMVGLPYQMSIAEAQRWLAQGQFPAGVTVDFGDRVVQVGAEQTELFT
jgi:hypothetical protein